MKRYFVGDFETTTYEGQTRTDVWASACVELFTEEPVLFNNINDQMNYYFSFKDDLVVFYHNLKFDGFFILSWLLNNKEFSQAYDTISEHPFNVKWHDVKEMKNNTYKYCISNMGQFYTITIKRKGKTIEFRDSLKLLPFSVKKIGDSFGTLHKKTEIEYTGFRVPYGEITELEKEYIFNDIFVVKEALETMFNEGHNRLTIGSCCMAEFKKITGKWVYDDFYPNIFDIELDESYGSPNAGVYVRKSYRGGWCYVAKGKENKIFRNGITADVNSLYPSMMSSESGNVYPIGKPRFWKGEIPKEVKNNNDLFYFVRIKTRFKIKEGFLPFIQIKGRYIYKGTESLTTSDVWNKETQQYDEYYIDLTGNVVKAKPILTLSKVDYELVLKHYDLYETEYLDGCYFNTEIGLFDEYIEKYRQQKMENKGAKREHAKLFLNNLYGQMAKSPDSSFKIAYLKDDGSIGLKSVIENDKTPGYIPIGSAITAYARAFTITAAQQNYYGVDNDGFCYADTDSIHCSLPIDKIKGITVHPNKFCCWKIESFWDEAIFTRQKTYIEHITHEDCEPVEKPYYDVKCAGMPKVCKDLFVRSMSDNTEETVADLKEKSHRDFVLEKKRTIEDFTIGLLVPGKLLPKSIPGGIVLKDTSYEMR